MRDFAVNGSWRLLNMPGETETDVVETESGRDEEATGYPTGTRVAAPIAPS